jgi:hypothetical protein
VCVCVRVFVCVCLVGRVGRQPADCADAGVKWGR